MTPRLTRPHLTTKAPHRRRDTRSGPVAERRVALLQVIASEPGLSRLQLAQRFSISERQMQDDLRALGHETYQVTATVEVVRDRGYRLRLTDRVVLLALPALAFAGVILCVRWWW